MMTVFWMHERGFDSGQLSSVRPLDVLTPQREEILSPKAHTTTTTMMLPDTAYADGTVCSECERKLLTMKGSRRALTPPPRGRNYRR